MKIAAILFAMLSVFTLTAKENITFEDIFENYSFSSRSVRGVRSMNDGLHYTALEGGSKIVKYSFQTGEAVDIILDLSKVEGAPKRINSYQFSDDEMRILIYTGRKSIYRHSYTADHYVYSFKTEELNKLSETGGEEQATFSPDGSRVAFVKSNNIYVYSILFKTEAQVTFDGKFNSIINGKPDWVYEEEFAFSRGFEWSPDSKKIGYMKFKEMDVRTFSFPLYKGLSPEFSDNDKYTGAYSFKYPKAGETNSVVEIYTYDVKAKKSIKADVGENTDQYIPRVKWNYSGSEMVVYRLNRHQNLFEMLYVNPSTGDSRVFFKERNDRYISESMLDNIFFLPDGENFVILSEQSGYSHLYLYNNSGLKVKAITSGEYDVTSFYGYDSVKKLFYYQAAKVTPMQREIYYVSLNGKKSGVVADEAGTTRVVFSTGYKYYMKWFTNLETPTVVSLHNSKGKLIRTLEDNSALKGKLENYNIPTKEFFKFKTSEGVELNGYMIKPFGFDKGDKKYPVLMTQYSGPNSQSVNDKFGISWLELLATKGYLVVCVDGRGTGARGEEFRKCTYLKLGQLESDDQIEAAKYLKTLPAVDGDNIGIWGWSYGGFMSSLCLGKGADTFKAAISVAPVTNFKYYDSVYTERYMRTPEENPEGYAYNPIKFAKNIKGKLLLMHGTADDNVHFQNAAELTEELVQNGIQFDMQFYVNRNHGIRGGNTTKHLYTRAINFLDNNLK